MLKQILALPLFLSATALAQTPPIVGPVSHSELTAATNRVATLEGKLSGATVNVIPPEPTTYSTYVPGILMRMGAYPTTGAFGWGTAPYSEAFTVQRQIPASNATTGVNPASLAGYANTANPHQGAVGVYGQGAAGANAPGAWGGNFLATNCDAGDINCVLGGHDTITFGIEADANIYAHVDGTTPLGSVFGVHIAGGSTTRPTGDADGVHVDSLAAFTHVTRWKSGVHVQNGAADVGVLIGALAFSPAGSNGLPTNPTSSASQPVVFQAYSSAAASLQATVQELADGTLALTPGAAGAPVQVLGPLAAYGAVTLGEGGSGPGHGSYAIQMQGVDAGGLVRQATISSTPDGGITLTPAQASAPVTVAGTLAVGTHLAATGPDAPTVSSCGSATAPDAGANDVRGDITIPAGQQTCFINFAHPTTAPYVTLTSHSSAYAASLVGKPNAAGFIVALSAAPVAATTVTWLAIQ